MPSYSVEFLKAPSTFAINLREALSRMMNWDVFREYPSWSVPMEAAMLFIVLHKVVLTSDSVDVILNCVHLTTEQYFPVAPFNVQCP